MRARSSFELAKQLRMLTDLLVVPKVSHIFGGRSPFTFTVHPHKLGGCVDIWHPQKSLYIPGPVNRIKDDG